MSKCQYGITTQRCKVPHKSVGLTCWSGNVGLALAMHGPVESNPISRSLVQHFVCGFKMTSHILEPHLKGGTCLALE